MSVTNTEDATPATVTQGPETLETSSNIKLLKLTKDGRTIIIRKPLKGIQNNELS
jgi:hypothetical protein